MAHYLGMAIYMSESWGATLEIIMHPSPPTDPGKRQDPGVLPTPSVPLAFCYIAVYFITSIASKIDSLWIWMINLS